MKNEELKIVLEKHTRWLYGNPCGERADLTGADLTGAVLRSADLTGADLTGAVLTGAVLRSADLTESSGVRYAQCAWSGHGERGRMLTAAVIAGETRLFCGCFSGSPEDLRKHIADGKPEYRASRTKALEFVLSCIEEGEGGKP